MDKKSPSDVTRGSLREHDLISKLEESTKTTLNTVLAAIRDSNNEISKAVKKSLTEMEDNRALELRDLRREMATSVAELQREIQKLKDNMNGIIPTLTIYNEGTFRQKCIDAMMRKTYIMQTDEGSASKMRKMYERFYDADASLSCILHIVHFQKVRVFIDFESDNIRQLKLNLKEINNQDEGFINTISSSSLADRKGYVSGKGAENYTVGHLAKTLLGIAIYEAFENNGYPYFKNGTKDQKKRLKEIIGEAERKKEAGEELDFSIRKWALNASTQLHKEINIVEAVPYIIAKEGSSKGRWILMKQLPSLLEYYEDYVVPALRKATKKEILREEGWN